MADQLDALLVELLSSEPRVGVLEASRRLGVARGTVQARLDRLLARGVICREAGAGESCTAVVLPVSALIEVGPAAAPAQ